jgi:ABC-type lipoprotein release transport system permease subunit
VVLGVLAGLSMSLAIAALSGARRADTAFARLTERTTAADTVVFPSQVSGAGTFDWDRVRDLPYVEDVAPWNLTFGTLEEGTGHEEPHALLFMPVDNHWLNTTDRPVVRAGRMWDPDADGEVLVDEPAADELGIGVGDRFTLHTYAPGQSAVGDPAGPMVDLEVVGVVRETSQFLFTPGMVFLSPGTLAAHPEMELTENAHVRLRHQTEDVPALRRDAAELLPRGTLFLDLDAVLRRVSTAISLERVAQTLLGVAVAAAALVFVGQALWRSVSVIDDDAIVLRAIGFTREERAVAATAPHLVTVVVAVPVALVGAWVLAPRFPIGYARTVDPSIGHQIDWFVAGPAVALTAVLIGAGAYAVAHLHGGRPDADKAARPSAVATALRAHTPVAVGLGTTLAFEPGRGRRRVPVGPALLGAVVGVLSIVGTLTIDHGLQDALHNPERAGVTWDASVLPGDGDYGERVDELEQAFLDDVAASDDVDDVAVIGRLVLPADEVGTAFFDVKPVKGDLDLVATDGAAPRADDEVALGPATADQLGVGIGDVVTVRGRSTRQLRVVGLALFPHEVHSRFTEGAWITPGLMAEIGEPYDVERALGTEQLAVVRWAEGVDPGAALAALQRRVGPERVAAPAELPPELLNLERVRSVPMILVGFLVVLAISALAHQLITSGRRRQRDFAVLRSIGFTRPMIATIVMSQSTCVGLVALLIGIPLGLALGRLGWSWVAHAVPLVLVPPLALAALALTIPITLVVANVVAAYPARRIARLGVAEALRTE